MAVMHSARGQNQHMHAFALSSLLPLLGSIVSWLSALGCLPFALLSPSFAISLSFSVPNVKDAFKEQKRLEPNPPLQLCEISPKFSASLV